MRRSSCRYLIRADLYRVAGKADRLTLIKWWFTNPNTRFLVIFRLGQRARATRGHLPMRFLTARLYKRYSVRYRIEIPFATKIGPGLRINHWVGGIVVNPKSRLGTSVTLTPGVIIGSNSRSGAPTIGDRVIINVGAKIIGGVTIGSDCQIGANAVVVRDIPDGSVAAGVPAKVLEGATPAGSWYRDFVSVLGPPPDDIA